MVRNVEGVIGDSIKAILDRTIKRSLVLTILGIAYADARQVP